jgi:TetR/AcrR family transcriptional regulator, cholesterol catabolism regulator
VASPKVDETESGMESGNSKSSRTRERLLNAAARVLSEKGFSGTRLSDIAEIAQVQAPAIYYYYASREDLIEAVVYTGAAAMHRHLVDALQALDASATPSARIATAVEAHLRHELEISDYARAMIRNANQLPEAVSRRALALVADYNDIWRGLVADLAAAGQLRDDVDPAVARMVVLGALNWASEWWNPARGSLETVIATTQSMVLHALRP